MLLDPVAGGEAQELRFVEAAFHAKVHIFDRRRVPKARELEQAREPAILPGEMLALQEQREPIFEVQRDDIGRAALFVERLSHRRQFQAMQQVRGLLREH